MEWEKYLPEAKVVAAAITVVVAAAVTVLLNAIGVVGITFDQVMGLLAGGALAVGAAYTKADPTKG